MYCCLVGESGPPHSKEFIYSVTVRGWEFTGSGKTKKLAKAAAAESALQYLHGVASVGPNAAGVSMAMARPESQTNRSRAEEMGKTKRERERERERERDEGREIKLSYLILYIGLDVAKMLADRIHKLSEEKFAELSVQLQSIPNADSLKKVHYNICHSTYTYIVYAHYCMF